MAFCRVGYLPPMPGRGGQHFWAAFCLQIDRPNGFVVRPKDTATTDSLHPAYRQSQGVMSRDVAVPTEIRHDAVLRTGRRLIGSSSAKLEVLGLYQVE